MKGGSEYHLTEELSSLEQWSNITLFLQRPFETTPKVLPGIFLGYVLHAKGIWKGDILVADIEELEHMDASELHARSLNAKEVSTPMKSENFIRWDSETSWRRSASENIHLNPDSAQTEEKNKMIFEENQTGLLQPHDKTHHGMMVKSKIIFGLFQEILFTAITLNPESSFTRREKSHSLFHWNTLTSPELPIKL